jgi:hypothetical protein
MKKFTRVTYHAANVLLPLSETARILRAMKYSGAKLAEQARRLKQVKDESATELLSFDDAVRASGQTREVLLSRYLRGGTACPVPASRDAHLWHTILRHHFRPDPEHVVHAGRI